MTTTEGTQEQGFIGPQLPKEKTLSPMENLAKFSEEARTEMQQFASADFPGTSKLLDWYMDTDNFKEVYGQVEKLRSKGDTAKGALAGRVFQDLAYATVARREIKLGSSKIVFSPQKTLEFWKTLFPDAQPVRSFFSVESLRGISVPDGLIVEQTENGYRAIALLEYTLREMDNRSNYHKGMHLGIISRDFPDIFEGVKIVWLNANQHRTVEDSSGGRLMLPFSKQEFRHFINWVFTDFRPGQKFKTSDKIQGETIPTPVLDATLS